MRAFMAVLVGLLCLTPCAFAQDADSDGLPDAIEVQLGTNPALDEGLELIIDDKRRGEGDANVRGEGRAPDVDQVLFAHVAGDRYVWKVSFAEDYLQKDTIFHLYTDIDDDKTTGRQDQEWVQGVDMMYSFVDGRNDPRFMNAAVRTDPALPVRGIIEGSTLYVCDDLKMDVQEGKTHFRMYILSHMREPTSDSDTTEWIVCMAPLHPERELPDLPYPKPEGFEAITMPNLAQLLHGLWQDERTVRLRPEDAEVEGLTPLMDGDYDGTGDPAESLTWSVPVDGEYHIALLLRDQAARIEGLDIALDDQKVGTVVGVAQANGDVLHVSSRAVSVSGGQTLAVRAAENSTAFRFGNLCLLAKVPVVPPLEIENLTAWPIPDEPGEPPGRVMVAWTTNRPSDGVISNVLGAGPNDPMNRATIEEGRGAVNNHIVMLPPEMKGECYQVKITCTEPDRGTHQPGTATVTRGIRWDRAALIRRTGARLAEPELTRIALTIAEPTGRVREQWPVSSGVPLPVGVLRDPGQCRIVDADGQPAPAQFTPIAWHPDGLHVKWLLVDFLAGTRGGDAAAYTLECNGELAEVEVEESISIKAEHIETFPPAPVGSVNLPVEIDTGPLFLTLDEGGFAPFASAMLNGMFVADADPAECGIEVTDGEGNVHSSALAPPDEVIIEEQGPVRATICVKGKLENADGASYMRYLCRMHFYVGKPYVRTVLTLENDVTDPDMNLIGSLRLRVPFELQDPRVTCGGDGEVIDLGPTGGVLQDEDFRFTAGAEQGKRADGWLMARGGAGAVAVAVRDFWRLYPKGLSGSDTGVTVDLLPELPAEQYADAGEDDITKLYYWCDGGKYKIRTGVRLTTEFAVDFDPKPTGDSYPLAALWQEPLFATCTPEWYCSSGGFGPMAPREAGKFDHYEAGLDSAFAKFMARRETIREYGFMNYGDWFGERTWNWGNQEYDTQWALAANFARTGNLAMLRSAEEAEWHNADIDTTHHWSKPQDVGRVWTHCTGHTGGYFPPEWKDLGGFNRGPRDTGHTYAQGHFFVYALTGERRYLDSGRKVADWLTNNTTDFRFYSERNVGWPMISLVGAHNVTGNPFYLNGAKLMADMAMWRLSPDTNGWGHFIDGNECKHEPRCYGAKTFMTGVLLHGLKMYDLAQPRDDIKETIRRNCNFVWEKCYIPADNGFIYSQCIKFRDKGSPWTVSLVGDGLAYGCLLDPERRHAETLKTATEGFMYQAGISDFGKGLTQGTCFMPLMLHDLEALGLTEFPAREGDG